MNNYDVRQAELADVRIIADKIRKPDADELWASSHLTPYQALMVSFMVSRDTTFTGTANGVPVCMFGIREPSMLSDTAVPWMIAGADLEFYSKAFLRRSKAIVNMWRSIYPFMQNYVDERNVVAVRWLQWVGFSVYYPKEYGADKLPFHRFDMRS